MADADFEPFYRRYYRERILELARGYPEEGRSLTIRWDDLYQYDPDLADAVRQHPERTLTEARDALAGFDVPVDVDLEGAAVQVAGYPRTTPIRELRSAHANRLISVRGIVRKATPVRPKVEVAVYECLTCGGRTELVQRGHELRAPNRCPHCERNTQFDRLDDRSRFVDAQRLRIQESPEGLRGGETPQNIDVHLEDDLTGVVSPGDRVTATGVLKLRERESGGRTSPILDVYLEGNHLELEEEEFEVMEIDDADVEAIEALAASDDIYEQVVDSIAPSIWGYDDEKLAMALQLFSGVRKNLPDGSRVRGDIHVLLVGDPGTGKSQLLQYISKIAPRSVYTSGKGSSAAGLTAAAVRDDFGDGSQWSLEAGALVLADQGIAAVDELDKMRCVTGDTLVHTTSGIKPISELARRASRNGEIERLENGRTYRGVEGKVWSMEDTGKLAQQNIIAIHEYDAPEDLISVELQSGESLTCTSDHPFIVLKGGEITNRAADGLEPGDWVCVPKRVPTALTDGGAKSRASLSEQKLPANQPEALGAILGYIAGDGNIFYNRSEGTYGIRFTNKEEELLNHFESVCVDAFGKEPSRPPSEQRSDGVQTVRLSGKWIVDELFELGTNNENYDGKVIPEGVSEGPRSMQAGFIRALADSEATVGDRAVKICSSSRGLLLGTKMLLLEFNISSQIVHRKRSTKRDIYELNITSKESIERFQQHIGFTLTRKNERLAAACGNVHGTRTILDVIPGMGDVLREIRNGLRLYVSEAGASHSSTYCNFENGDANLSFRLGRSICQRFNQRKRTAEEDLLVIRGKPSWEELEEIRQRYHISQKEISDQLPVSQQYVSEHWGTDANLRDDVEEVLSSIVKNVAAVNIDPLEKLVNADVKWRKVTKIEEEAPSMSDPRVKILRHELCELLGYKDVDTIEGHAKQLLSFDPNDVSTWDELRETLKKHQISFADLAQRLDVVGSTVSRWFNGVVDVGNFEEVKQIALELIETKRKRMTKLLNEINDRRKPKVYDLTVEGTHNYLANGMVVHNSEDRSAMHEALEQQSVSVSKAGINATLQARCALLGAANPTYGRFDQYEPIAEQIDLEPALVSRFDLIFTVDDLPDQERDERIAEHILRTNYAGELSSRQAIEVDGSAVAELEDVSEHVTPPIEPERLRTYVAYATQRCIPTMTEEARQAIKDFYLDLRAEGVDEDSPIPMTARKLEALVRLAEASARIRLADEVTREDAERVIELVRASMGDIGFDPETGTYDVDMIETGTPKTQRDRIRTLKGLIESLEDDFEDGIPLETIVEQATERGLAADRVEHELEKMKQTGEIYEPSGGRFRLA